MVGFGLSEYAVSFLFFFLLLLLLLLFLLIAKLKLSLRLIDHKNFQIGPATLFGGMFLFLQGAYWQNNKNMNVTSFLVLWSVEITE